MNTNKSEVPSAVESLVVTSTSVFYVLSSLAMHTQIQGLLMDVDHEKHSRNMIRSGNL